MKQMKVRLTLVEELLGTASSNPKIHEEFIASNAPDAPSREEEIAAMGVEAVAEKGRTVFPRDEKGHPFLWDYQIRGFFKESCSFMRKIPNSASSKIKAYKKEIDGLIFVEERRIPLVLSGPIGDCQRPLRAQTLQGERVALASSETAPAGTVLEFTITCMIDGDMDAVKEWLTYGRRHGLGQWRNGGKGAFRWEQIPA